MYTLVNADKGEDYINLVFFDDTNDGHIKDYLVKYNDNIKIQFDKSRYVAYYDKDNNLSITNSDNIIGHYSGSDELYRILYISDDDNNRYIINLDIVKSISTI